MTTITAANGAAYAFSAFDGGWLSPIVEGTATTQTATEAIYTADIDGVTFTLTITGSGFSYLSGALVAGTITGFEAAAAGVTYLTIDDFSMTAGELGGYVAARDGPGFIHDLLSGPDSVLGHSGNDLLAGYTGDDVIDGGSGQDMFLFEQDAARSDLDIRSAYDSLAGAFVTEVIDTTGIYGQETLYRIEQIGFVDANYEVAGSFALNGVQQNRSSNLDNGRFDDVLLQNQTTGQIVFKNVDVSGSNSFGNVLGALPSGWKGVDTGDVTGDGRADLFVQNSNNGSIYYVDVSSGSPAWGVVSAGLTSDYRMVDTGDITGDGIVDVLVVNDTNGDIYYADMNAGGTFGGWGYVGRVGGFRVVGLGDTDRDGYSDVVVQNGATGQTYIADMNAGVMNGWTLITGPIGAQWVAKDVVDVFSDGRADIVFQNSTTGAIMYEDLWEQDGVVQVDFNTVTNNIGTAWSYAGAADVNNDGFRDVIIHNTSNGLVYWADMENGAFNGWGFVASVGTGWAVV